MRDAVRAYRESVVRGATPVGLVVILYEEVQRSLRNGLRGVEAGSVEQRTVELSHAIRVMGHLQAVLDYDAGGQVALNLARFYNVARAKILEAGFRNDARAVESLIEDFTALTEAWKRVDLEVNGGENAPTSQVGHAADAATAMEHADDGVRVEG